MTRFKPPITSRLADPDAERARRELTTKIVELQTSPFAALEIIANVRLEDGVATPIPHKLGRPARWVRESCVRGASTAGLVQEVRSPKYDPASYVVLVASGYGATITCSVEVR